MFYINVHQFDVRRTRSKFYEIDLNFESQKTFVHLQIFRDHMDRGPLTARQTSFFRLTSDTREKLKIASDQSSFLYLSRRVKMSGEKLSTNRWTTFREMNR